MTFSVQLTTASTWILLLTQLFNKVFVNSLRFQKDTILNLSDSQMQFNVVHVVVQVLAARQHVTNQPEPVYARKPV
jgi:hypothetical protein